MLDSFKHYVVDGEMMSMKQMRQILEVVLGHGNMAYHYSASDVVRLLRADGRLVEVIGS
jgi:hypothetical protein